MESAYSLGKGKCHEKPSYSYTMESLWEISCEVKEDVKKILSYRDMEIVFVLVLYVAKG